MPSQSHPRGRRPGSTTFHIPEVSITCTIFTDEQLSRAVWIYGERAIAAAQTKLPPAFELPGVKHILFRGHSESDVQQLAAESGDDRSVVIGVGGGALLDTAKAPRPPSRSAVCCRSDDRRYLRRLDTALRLV